MGGACCGGAAAAATVEPTKTESPPKAPAPDSTPVEVAKTEAKTEEPPKPAPDPVASEPPKEEAPKEEPKTEEPVKEEPKTEEPAKEEPKVEEQAAPAPAPEAGKPQILLLGPPSSGKGVLVSKLVEAQKLESMREIWLAKRVKEKNLASAEKLAALEGKPDDETLVQCLKECLEDAKATGALVDGMPKNEAQAKLMTDWGSVKLIVVENSREAILEHHAKKVFDPETSTSYHLTHNPPPDDIKDRCIQTKMDTEEAVTKNLDPYFEQLDKILAVFPAAQVIKVKGTTVAGSPEEAAMYDEACKQLGI